MSNESKRFYEFGEFRLDAANRLLLRSGTAVALKQKAIDILIVLVENRGAVVEKEALMERVWPDTFVDESNLTQHIYTLRKAFGDADYIETIPRRGYRFVAEVVMAERERIVIHEETETKHPALAIAAAALALVVVAVAFLLTGGSEQPGNPATPLVRSLAVLPFRSLDHADEYLGLGIADTLITKLSAAGRLIVRPTSAILAYSEAKSDALKAGRELGVDSVVDGSIQRQNDRVRITVRLLRTRDAQPLWAGQFDEPVVDFLKLQDSIAERVTARSRCGSRTRNRSG